MIRRDVATRFALVAAFAAQPVHAILPVKTALDSASSFDSAGLSAVAYDATRPHVVYVDLADNVLKYMHRNGAGAWHAEPVRSEDLVRSGVSLALDSRGDVHVSYLSYDRAALLGNVEYAHRSCTDGECVWTHDTVAVSVHIPNAANQTSLVVDADGTVRVAYFDHPLRQLRHATRRIGQWEVGTVAHSSGGTVSQVIRFGAATQLAYSDASTETVHLAWLSCPHPAGLARRSRAELTEPSPDESCSWRTELLDRGSIGNVQLGRSGDAHVAYTSRGSVRYAVRPCDLGQSCSWTTESIAPAGNTRAPALALTTGGAPRISYLRERGTGTAELNLASRTSTGWEVEAVASYATSSGLTSLTLDAENVAHIGFEALGSGVESCGLEFRSVRPSSTALLYAGSAL